MTARPRRIRHLLLHGCRAGLLTATLWLIHDSHRELKARQLAGDVQPPSLVQVQPLFPRAASLSAWEGGRGGWSVVDSRGSRLGFVLQTSPTADEVIGYSGPTNVLIGMDQEQTIIGIRVIDSGDTPEHVQQMIENDRFMRSFGGITWETAATLRDVDAVSGATLTSLAVAEAVMLRLGDQRPSLRFPREIELEEVRRFLPEAYRLVGDKDRAGVVHVLSSKDIRLGWAARTAPLSDNIIGYQGPTDTLIVFDIEGRVRGIALRDSYESPEYIEYVTEDEYFMTVFDGMTMAEVAALDWQAGAVEGVSGATMTSLTMVRALQERVNELATAAPSTGPKWNVSPRNVGTAAVVTGGLIMAFTRLRGIKWVRIGFQLLLITYLGFINGDLLSQELFVGWARHGLPWKFAPGLILLSAAAMIVPLTTRTQVYCHQLCPHGAAQQLLKNRLPWKLRLPRRVAGTLQLLPWLLLMWVVWVSIRQVPANLAAIEPFDAYLIRVAGWATIAVAAVGLIASLFVPMAYCRFGCPTGAVLNFVRFNSGGDHVTRRDAAALLLVLAAAAFRYI